MWDLLAGIWRFLFRSSLDEHIEKLAARLRWHHRFGLFGVGLVGLAAVFMPKQISDFTDRSFIAGTVLVHGSAPALAPESMAKFSATLKDVQTQLAFKAQQFVHDPNPPVDGSWIWAAAQLVAAAPEQSAPSKQDYFDFVRKKIDAGCGCFKIFGVPAAVASAWVMISYAELGERAPDEIVSGALGAQNAQGWWSVALDAAGDEGNASTYMTALLAIALADQAGVAGVEAAAAAKYRAAASRAILWLSSQAPATGTNWSDYPFNPRRTSNNVFAAMSAAAAQDAGGSRETGAIARSLVSDFASLGEPKHYIESDAFVRRRDGTNYIDKYRHVPFGWRAWGLAAAYSYADFGERVKIQKDLRDALAADFQDETLRREEWLAAEDVFTLSRALVLLAPPAAKAK